MLLELNSESGLGDQVGPKPFPSGKNGSIARIADTPYSQILSAEATAQTTHPVAVITQVYETGGVMKAGTMEKDEGLTICKGYPMAGDKLIATGRNHVLLWTSGIGDAVMFATDNLEEIKPLHDLTIGSKEIPILYLMIGSEKKLEGLIAGDIFPEPGKTTLTYIGRTNSDESKLQEIRERAQVQNFKYIQAGSPDDRRFNFWMVRFEGKDSEISIFPAGGDIYLSCHVSYGSPEVTAPSLYRRYCEYFRNGGVIRLSLIRDASSLNRNEMRLKYPRNRFYTGDPEEQICYIQNKTKITLTEEQKKLYYNLRWISTEAPQVIYDVGLTPPKRKQSGEKTVFIHPTDLDEIGLLSQIFKFTGDNHRESLLAWHCDTVSLWH